MINQVGPAQLGGKALFEFGEILLLCRQEVWVLLYHSLDTLAGEKHGEQGMAWSNVLGN